MRARQGLRAAASLIRALSGESPKFRLTDLLRELEDDRSHKGHARRTSVSDWRCQPKLSSRPLYNPLSITGILIMRACSADTRDTHSSLLHMT